jgi:phosphinothricin acetyltransferase
MIKIREVTPADAPHLLEIYAPYVEETAVSFEYDVPTLEEFEGRISRILSKYPYLVAEKDGRIVGYAYATEFKGREAFRWTVETSVYVERSQRQGGIGRMLYEALEHELRQRGFQSMCACIAYTEREDDPHLTNDSVFFHQRMGFAMAAHFHRCGWKFMRWYDMVWMEKLIGSQN